MEHNNRQSVDKLETSQCDPEQLIERNFSNFNENK